jgi:hypothetical protein
MSKDKATQVTPAAMAAAASETTNTATPTQARVVTAAKPATTVTTPTQATTSTASPLMSQFKNLCDTFVTIKNGDKTPRMNGTKTVTYAERSLKAFRSLMNFVWAHQDNLEILNGLRQFFVTHRDGILSHSQAMPQIGTLISSETERSRLEYMWLLMFELTNKNRSRSVYEFELANQVIRNPQCSPDNGFIQYVASRMR